MFALPQLPLCDHADGFFFSRSSLTPLIVNVRIPDDCGEVMSWESGSARF